MNFRTLLLNVGSVALVLAALLNSCSDSSTAPANGSISDPILPGREFGVIVNVEDQLHRPVTGLDVAVWGIVSYPGHPQKALATPRSTQSTTSIMFSLPMASSVRLEVRNLRDSLVETLIAGQSLEAGVYAYHWMTAHWVAVNESTYLPDFALANGIYKIRMLAKGLEDGAPVFVGQKYAVLMDDGNPLLFGVPGFSIGKVVNGEFATTDPALFPGAFPYIPDIPYTRDDPTILGSVIVTKQACIVLSDPATGRYQKYEVSITPGMNAFTLQWRPATSDVINRTPGESVQPAKGGAALIGGGEIPTEYALHQNYPNPFN